jgi:signal transduction histidine kinase/DNA-binding response OmpR family regulator
MNSRASIKLMPSMRYRLQSHFSSLRKHLKVRKELPAELVKEFVEYKDINSIDRMHVAAWIAFSMSLFLLILDFMRYQRGLFETEPVKVLLFYCHLIGLFFIVPAVHIARNKEWIIQTRLRRGIVIWGMVVWSLVFMMGQSILVFLDRHSLVMYLALIFISGWMFAMSHRERLAFHAFTFTIMAVVILLTPMPMEVQAATYFELIFLTIIAFFFDAFDFNLRVSNFFNSRALLEEQMRIRKLEEFKSRFFTNLTHELRTPLTVISGMAQEIAENPKRWASEGSEVISRNSGNLLNLINQILDLSKLETGSLPVNMVQGDVVSYIGYIVDAFRGHAGTKKINLHFLSEEEEIIMDYDPDKYFSILSNLLSNALKFTPDEGNIYVQLSIRTSADPSILEIIVRDTGKGIEAEDLEHIFERFYQVNDNFENKSFGTGIGLSIVHELVHLLNGEVKVRSIPGKGTQFTIRMPVVTQAEPVNPGFFRQKINRTASNFVPPDDFSEEENAPADDGKPEVLIVEDNPDVLKFLQACLGDLFQLTFRRDGQAGIEKAIESVPDLVISDVMMPVKDGLQLCRELKSNEVTSHIPIILLSARTDAASRIAGLECGADLYVSKPFDKKELRVQARHLLDSRKELQARYADPSQPIDVEAGHSKEKENEFVRKVRDIILEHLDESEFGVMELCRSVYLSRTQLHKKLKALTGLSASLFIRQVRLFAGRELLQSPDLNVTEVAYKVGFTDPNYFTRCFTQEFGLAPSETRKHV